MEKERQTQTGKRHAESAEGVMRPSVQTGLGSRSSTIFASLEGKWNLDRTIENIGTFQGTAVFASFEPETLSYREDGDLVLNSGFTCRAFREYYYQLAEDQIVVSFADAAPGARTFLRLYPQDGLADPWARDVHYCGPDQYECTYRFVSQDHFTTRINVEGKAKRYFMNTVYTRNQ